MAPPSRSGSRPGRALAALAVLILIMLISITGKDTFSPGNWHKQFKVGLGLDLSSGTEVVLKAATPPASVPVPILLPPSKKVTVPDGVPDPGEAAETVAVKVTLWPNVDGLTDDTMPVEVFALATVIDAGDEVDGR